MHSLASTTGNTMIMFAAVRFLTLFICSEEVPKGTECYEAFKTMQDCFSKYPAVYNKGGDDEPDDLDSVLGASSSENNSNIDSADQLDIAGSSPIPSSVATEVPEAKQVAAAH